VSTKVGLGSDTACLNVYIANRPPLSRYENLSSCGPLGRGEIAHIAKETGNHWRKIFNVYAKLVYCLDEKTLSLSRDKNADKHLNLGAHQFDCWQSYRDAALLQAGSNTALWFSPLEVSSCEASKKRNIHIVMGRQYAASLHLPDMEIYDRDFAINVPRRIIVTPYFDYRQLSNVKLEVLADLIVGLI
jgi:hypothetical protein